MKTGQTVLIEKHIYAISTDDESDTETVVNDLYVQGLIVDAGHIGSIVLYVDPLSGYFKKKAINNQNLISL